MVGRSGHGEPAGPWTGILGIVLVVGAAVAGVWFALFAAPGRFGQVAYGLTKALMLAVPLAWLLVREHGSLAFASRPAGRGMQAGALSGGAIAAAMVGGYFLFGDALVDRARVGATADVAGFGDPFVFGLLAFYLIVVNPALEEFAWRWFVQTRLYRFMPVAAALPACAGLFTLHHVVVLAAQAGTVATVLGSLAVFAVGLLWSWMYWKYDSLWPAYVSHALVDVALVIVAADLVFG